MIREYKEDIFKTLKDFVIDNASMILLEENQFGSLKSSLYYFLEEDKKEGGSLLNRVRKDVKTFHWIDVDKFMEEEREARGDT